MRFLNYLNEEWYKTLGPGLFGIGKPLNIYLNPSSSDFRDMIKTGEFSGEIRFVGIPEENKLYVWDSYKAVHDDVGYNLKIDFTKACWGDGPLNNQYKVEVYNADFHYGSVFRSQDAIKSILDQFSYCLDLSKVNLFKRYVNEIT
jgi:hypothetical protein